MTRSGLLSIRFLAGCLFLNYLPLAPRLFAHRPDPGYQGAGSFIDQLYFAASLLFRLSPEFVCLLLIFAFLKPVNKVLTTAIALYVLALVYKLYDLGILIAFSRKPVLFDDIHLIKHTVYLLVDLTWRTKLFFGFASVFALFLLAWAIPSLIRFVVRNNYAIRFYLPWRVALSSFVLILGSNFAAFGFEDRVFAIWSVPRMIENVKHSLGARTVDEKIDREPVDSTYFHLAEIRLRRRPNVNVLMVESYGSILLRSPTARKRYLSHLKHWQKRLHNKGWLFSTGLSESPVAGGGSWLSKATLFGGMQLNSFSLMSRFSRKAKHLPHLRSYFTTNGYETILLQPNNRNRPGMKLSNLYGFDEVYNLEQMNYSGPPYGWGIIPDQYSLNYVWEKSLRKKSPYFFFFMTVSSHYPWETPPPLHDDWRQLQSPKATSAQMTKVFGQIPSQDQSQLSRYCTSLLYSLEVIWRFTERLDSNNVVIIVGDHEPPVLESPGRNKKTPVHVLSRTPFVHRRADKIGFHRGLFPRSDNAPFHHSGLYPVFVHLLADTIPDWLEKPPLRGVGYGMLKKKKSKGAGTHGNEP